MDIIVRGSVMRWSQVIRRIGIYTLSIKLSPISFSHGHLSVKLSQSKSHSWTLTQQNSYISLMRSYTLVLRLLRWRFRIILINTQPVRMECTPRPQRYLGMIPQRIFFTAIVAVMQGDGVISICITEISTVFHHSCLFKSPLRWPHSVLFGQLSEVASGLVK